MSYFMVAYTLPGTLWTPILFVRFGTQPAREGTLWFNAEHVVAGQRHHQHAWQPNPQWASKYRTQADAARVVQRHCRPSRHLGVVRVVELPQALKAG